MKPENLPIAEKFEQLGVTLIQCKTSANPFSFFTHLSNLTHIEVYAFDSATTQNLAVLSQFESLRILKFDYVNSLSDEGVMEIAKLTTLKSLQLSVLYENSNPTDKGVKHLSSLRNLEALALENLQAVTACGIPYLSDFRALHTFKVDLKNVKGDFLKGCDNLKALEIRYMQLDSSFNLPTSLQKLTLVHTKFPENDGTTIMRSLSSLQNLNHLVAAAAILKNHREVINTLKSFKPNLVTEQFKENI